MNENSPVGSPEYIIPNDYELARRSLRLSPCNDGEFFDTTNHDPKLVEATVNMYFSIIIDPALERAKSKK